MLQIVSEAFVKSGQIFPTEAVKTFAVERLKKIVMSSALAAFKAFRKHITPQAKLMAPAFRLHVRNPPEEQPASAYSADFFGVAVEKYYYTIVYNVILSLLKTYLPHFLEAENSCIILYYL